MNSRFAISDQPQRLVTCPHCGNSARYDANNPFRPFCSERCRLIDLGAWAAEAYRLPEQESAAAIPEDNSQ